MSDRGSGRPSALARLGRPSALALPLLLTLLNAAPAQPAATLLAGASLTAARDFAVAAARARGWTAIAVDPTRATFEQTIAEAPSAVPDATADAAPDATDPPPEPVAWQVLRIYADFAEEATGVRVSLRAEELDAPGTDEERMTDVTDRYGENLSNALASLQAKWQASAQGTYPARAGPDSARATALSPQDPRPHPTGDRRLALWAYYAEAYARSQGCELTDAGAALESAGPDWERHRVDCTDGHSVLVQCQAGDCTRAP